MPAARSILSVVRMMLEAGLPHDEILRTLDSCERALPSAQRHPDDRAPVVPGPPPVDSGDGEARLRSGLITESYTVRP